MPLALFKRDPTGSDANWIVAVIGEFLDPVQTKKYNKLVINSKDNFIGLFRQGVSG
jgi:hypothetical protein